jgi:uncharacterized protein YcgI (DUF1989 family)
VLRHRHRQLAAYLKIPLTEAQLDLARREVARRLPGASLAEGFVAVAAEELAAAGAEQPASAAAAAPGAVAPAPTAGRASRVELELRPGQGLGVEVRRGDVVRVQQVGDGQGADLIAYDLADRSVRFSAARTRMFAGTRPTVGDDLWSGAPGEAALLTIVADSHPSHDLTFPACSRFEYEHYAGLHDHANCFDVQVAVVEAWGLEPTDVPDPLNLWLPTSVDADGRLVSEPTTARRGDHVDLRANRDVLVVISPCPDDVFGTSRWEPKPIRVAVSGAPPAPEPAARVVDCFPPPATNELTVAVPDDLAPQLGPDLPRALRERFFRAWLRSL